MGVDAGAFLQRRHRIAGVTPILLGVLLTLWALPFAAWSQRGGEGQALRPKLEGQALIEVLKQGGHVILLRHTATEQVAPDRDLFDIRDCGTQRNLSEQGRRQARLMGQAFARLGIKVSEVLSSPYCRCLETARLAFGRVAESEVLSVFEGLSVAEKSERGAVVRKMLATAPEPGTNSVLVTHTGTLLYSFGLQSKPEGIAHVFRPEASGRAGYVGMITPEQWPRLAGLDSAAP